MKFFLTAVIIPLILILNTGYASGSWLIDPERFHVSVHGQIACHDCHSEIDAYPSHPNPEDVNKSLKDFFRLEQCITCHGDVLEAADEGLHGGEKIADEQELEFCIDCHDPHYQLSYSESGLPIDLTQPLEKKCSLCHEMHKELPQFSPEDEQCLNCHRFLTPEAAGAPEYIANLCFHCHDQRAISKNPGNFARFDISAYGSTVHADTACTTCHLQAVEFQHANRELGDCRRCHLPHGEKVAHDAHIRVSCEACHLNQVSAVKDLKGGRIQWQINRRPDELSAVHAMASSNEDVFCRRCHFGGNTIGAAAMILPAKSMMCMPCHAATFSIGDTTTIIALLIFGLGVLFAGSIWFSGSLTGATAPGAGSRFIRAIQSIAAVIFSGRIFAVFAALVMDGLLQRRLFRVSRIRWFMHALIFFAFLFRFCWGLTALVGSIWLPGWQGIWMMLDKNHPLTAFMFDLTGVLAISGAFLILVRKYGPGSQDKPEGLPAADWPAYGLMGGIIIVGFVLEGMRIAMTGAPEGSHNAFLGFAISRLFNQLNLTDIYGYMWYTHAILTGAFVAYLPFSRMFHIMMAPLSLAIHAIFRSHGRPV